MTVAESQKLYDCAARLPKDAVVVEIGTFQGGSAAIMAAAIEGTVYTIDINPKTEPSIPELENIQFITGTSKEVAETWDKPIDMLFIDGDHFYVGVHEDIKNWVSKVKDGGIVCFHDYGSHTEVTIAVNEALMKRISFPNHSLLAIIK